MTYARCRRGDWYTARDYVPLDTCQYELREVERVGSALGVPTLQGWLKFSG